ncbi:MAG: sugar isomerase [Oscillospiraceae bacterium]|nr:sugar isomerase [Oscillospiraceae bacterium]
MRAKKAALNSASMLIYVLVFIVSGLIIPRLILTRFGSDYNGVIASINQFIGYIALLAAGAAGATRAALYRPLADNDKLKVSSIMWATESFFRKVALIFVSVLAVVAALYPFLVSDTFDWFFVFSLTIILGGSMFCLYFFGITYQTLLVADQRAYMNTLIHICVVILNIAVASFMIMRGFDIRIVMFATAVVLSLHPLFLYFYVRKRYKLDSSAKPDNSAIKQRWDAFAHQLADFVQLNAGIIIVTVFLGIREASVFTVYIFIIRTVRIAIISVTGYGVEASFGDMIAKNEQKALQGGVRINEFLVNGASAFLLSCTALLIVPFVIVYTTGVYDVNYYEPLFALIACAAEFAFVARIPAQSVIYAAGHFRQTRDGAIAEMVINITLSIILVQFMGLAGVAMGSLFAVIFRTVQMSLYASNHIIKRSFSVFLKKMVLSFATVCIIIAVSSLLPQMTYGSLFTWVLYALPVAGIAFVVVIVISLLFYRQDLTMLLHLVRKVVRPS